MSLPECANNKVATAPGGSSCFIVLSVFATCTLCQVGINICSSSVMQQYITTMRQMIQVHCSRQHGTEQQLLSVPYNPHSLQISCCNPWFLVAFQFILSYMLYGSAVLNQQASEICTFTSFSNITIILLLEKYLPSKFGTFNLPRKYKPLKIRLL